MKQIINGKKYDTETAKRLDYWSNGYAINDFNHCQENLYLKKTGEYFLHGEGGALSSYAQPCPSGGWSGGEAIIPLTETTAREWAERHLDGDEYETIFGEVAE